MVQIYKCCQREESPFPPNIYGKGTGMKATILILP